MSDTISEKELRKLRKQGFSVVGREKPVATAEQKLIQFNQKLLEYLRTLIESNIRTASDATQESKKQTVAIIKALEKKPEVKETIPAKKKFDLVPERDKKGFITRIRIEEL